MFPAPINSITLKSSNGFTRVLKVRNNIAYDEFGNPIDSKRFGSNKRYILNCDSDFILEEPNETVEEYRQKRSSDLDAIKNNPIHEDSQAATVVSNFL